MDKVAKWSDIKTRITKFTNERLVSLVADLYRLSKENQTFLHTRFLVIDEPLDPYKKIIAECMYPDITRNKSIQIAKAKKAISDYSKARGDLYGEVELMTFFIEKGTALTRDYGDIDENFYDALNRMYRLALNKIPALPPEFYELFKERLRTIMTSSVHIGWGYYDILREDYYQAFPEDEEL